MLLFLLICIVRNFARQTGDFRGLSIVDLKVLALAYQLDKEYNGGDDHLRKEPAKPVRTKHFTHTHTHTHKGQH